MRVISRKKIPLALEIAPLIDIVFLLLIFFLLTSLGSQQMQLDLPQASTANQSQESLNVWITQEGEVFVEEKKIDLEDLLPFLTLMLQQRENKTITIKADAEVPFKLPVKVMDISRKAGAKGVNLATRSSGK